MTRGKPSLDDAVEQTAVTSNPAAGTISVDVKTFTGRGRVTAVVCTCLADANPANRNIIVQKVSGAVSLTLCIGVTFTAGTTGTLTVQRGYTASPGINYGAMPDIDFGPGDILRVAVSTGQVGDDMSAITYSFKEAP